MDFISYYLLTVNQDQNILWAMFSTCLSTSIQASPFRVLSFSSYAFPLLSPLDIQIFHVLWFWYNLKCYWCNCLYFLLCFVPVLKIMILFVCVFIIACFRNFNEFNKFWSPIQYKLVSDLIETSIPQASEDVFLQHNIWLHL